MTIPLTVHRKEIKKIFYKNRNLSLFLGPKTSASFGGLLGTIASLFLIEYFFQISNLWLFLWVLLVFGSFFLYLRTASAVWNLRKDVTTFLDKIDLVKQHTIVYDDETFQLIQDETVHVAEWSNFTKIRIHEDHILLDGETDFLIPHCTMTTQQFNDLSTFVKNKSAVE
ncbi:MAG: hypothetical protein V4604_14150 [Bacteroidota bacterium]